ncbi:MAG: hypothetical protein ACK4PH_26745 [Aquincola tertiaricarbonis]
MLVFVEPSPPPAGDWPGRPDDERLLRGAGAYVDDLAAAAQAAVVCFVRSPHAHARLAAVEAGAIGSWPGVLAVWTAADLQQAGVQPLPLVSGLQRPDGGAATSATRPTVVVTRPREQAAAWVEALGAAGWPVVALPLIEIAPAVEPAAASASTPGTSDGSGCACCRPTSTSSAT